MSLIMFDTGQALPLVGTRILCPRMSRGVSAEQPSNGIGLRPRPQAVREPGSSTNRAQTRMIHVHAQSAIAFCPRTKTRQGTGLEREHALDSDIREQASDAATPCPLQFRDLGQSMAVTTPLPGTVHALCLATAYPGHRISVSVSQPTQFPVRIHIIPAYGHV